MAQLYVLTILNPTGRPNNGFGGDPAILTRILSGNVFLGALLGSTPLAVMPGSGAMTFLICVAVAGLAIVVWCLVKSNVEMKLFLVFTAMLFFVSLWRPTAYAAPGNTVWQVLAEAPDVRYWFLPSLAFAWSLLWCARSGNTVLKSLSAVFLCTMCFGAALNWRHPGLQDLHFAEYARSFEAAPPGTVMVIPENPEGWKIRLVKRSGF
jgi:hypothetical protein